MQAITAKRVLLFVISVFSFSLVVGCSGLEHRPANRGGYLYYPTAMVNADQALDEARAAGKDKSCPAEFNTLKNRVDEAYEVYMACHTDEAIAMSLEAIGGIKALCPPPPVCELTAIPDKIDQGQSTTLRLTTSGKVKSAKLDGTAAAETGGVKTVSPSSTTSYTAEVAGSGGSTTCSATVVVTVPPPPPAPLPTPQPTPPLPPEPLAANVIDRLTIHVNFNFDKSDIRKADEAELKKAIAFVGKYPGAKVDLQGYTDSKGTEQYNQTLSERRAEAVRQYLIKEGAVSPAMISAKGYGESKPVAPNRTAAGKDNPAGRAENRRVEILIISE